MGDLRYLAFSWTIGATFGFEFIDSRIMGRGWALHLFIIKVIYLKQDIDLSSFDKGDL